MKLVTKSGHKFAIGLFWQIPDEGKRRVNLSKIAKDTKHSMFCQMKTINPTWGFCRKEELCGEKKVASLGKFIVEVSKISGDYANCIICYKFKNVGEVDENNKPLNVDLFGYVVLLNGTICPDEGEYVGGFDLVRESIIQKAKKHEIETLYLPVEVADRFFSIFEILTDAESNDKLLIKIMSVITLSHVRDLNELIKQNIADAKQYLQLLDDLSNTDIGLLKKLIQEKFFIQKLNKTKELTIKYLISQVVVIAFTSDEIFWQESKFKNLFNKALMQPIAQHLQQKYKISILGAFLLVLIYLCYMLMSEDNNLDMLAIKSPPPITIIKALSVTPARLIDVCLVKNDRFFKELDPWILTGIKCDSLGATLTFTPNTEAAPSTFAKLIGKQNKNIKLEAKLGSYTIAYNLNTFRKKIHTVSKSEAVDNLIRLANNYSLQFRLTSASGFSIVSKQSPVFLLQHSVLDNILLKDITMNYDGTSGFYIWTLNGEI